MTRVGGGSEVWRYPLELIEGSRWDPHFWVEKYKPVLDAVRRHDPKPFGDYIETITYGQVGRRLLSTGGAVRYLQVINIQDTGIDFEIKPDRVREGGPNDPERSRIQARDILLTNNSFGDSERLLGRCVVVPEDPPMTNVSQHIDVIRVRGINPFFACAFLKSSFGQEQIRRQQHGVRSGTISFGMIRSILIPTAPEDVQTLVEKLYHRMDTSHHAAIERRGSLGTRPGTGRVTGRILNRIREHNPEFARLEGVARKHLAALIGAIEAYIRGEASSISVPDRPAPARS